MTRRRSTQLHRRWLMSALQIRLLWLQLVLLLVLLIVIMLLSLPM